jgi:hypothetical protein
LYGQGFLSENKNPSLIYLIRCYSERYGEGFVSQPVKAKGKNDRYDASLEM